MIESRAQWQARSPRSTTYVTSTNGVKAHYTGGYVDPDTLSDHAKCRIAIRNIQNQHMDNNGWNDFGYSMWVCNHTAGLGRGPHILPSANGPGLNSGHYAVLFLVGNSGVVTPTDAMKYHFYEARTYLINYGSAGRQIQGHRDGYPTDCPGSEIYRWIRAGAPISTPPLPPTEDASMKYMSLGSDERIVVPPGVWFDIPFTDEFADPEDEHGGRNPSILSGNPCTYALDCGFTLVAPFGALIRTRVAEFKYRTGTPPVDELVEVGNQSECNLSSSGNVQHVAVGNVQEGRKLRVQLMHSVQEINQVTLTRARVQVLYQE